MKIKMKTAKNVYGVRVDKGAILKVGREIPKWQALKFIELDIATEFVVKKKKADK